MIGLIHPEPTSIYAVAALFGSLFLWAAALLIAKRRRGPAGSEVTQGRDSASMRGVAVQALGFLVVGFGPLNLVLGAPDGRAIAEVIVVLALIAGVIALFMASSRAMGRNWAIVARTRDDHQLVTWGPFAVIRNPIYVALFVWILVMALALGHWRALILGVPLYWIGTWMRVAREEKLLRAQFGAAYDAYAARVKRFIPGLV
ncbi:isoprenylcysteine carboxylmethyltransferase family protein [Sphingomonas sp. HITSZ_GF]|uniref:methyltransferase family protein n=1 Tax=Sphingomonas sp. HITSZ_GF TaxID=3037247 RepID=UPI00240DA22C|nr:isoprenylcysteine carboxylmethyltransferase family protein [Sphingomonas sp. HITSZ_GF]MDG2532296.1 isoprenylcysteine carboxylmethyltransferase family protein [Sphingomonas sp. HITSZ_GF]